VDEADEPNGKWGAVEKGLAEDEASMGGRGRERSELGTRDTKQQSSTAAPECSRDGESAPSRYYSRVNGSKAQGLEGEGAQPSPFGGRGPGEAGERTS